MKTTLFLLLMGCGLTKVSAQNTVVVNQQGGSPSTGHDVSVSQQGGGNTSVVNQSTAGTGNRAVISQSGTGNVATIQQGNGLRDSVNSTGQSVNVTQLGGGETVIDQTDGSNTISIWQRGGVTPAPSEKKKKNRARPGRSE